MLVFLTIYLGLIAGRQPFELRADPAVKSVQLLLDGKEVAALTEAPWRTTVDLGTVIEPHEIVAVGRDANGNEIARVSQVINLPRPRAEVHLVVQRNAKGVPTDVEVEGRHIAYFEPERVTLQLDGVPLRLDRHRHASLPPLDIKRPHDVAAEMDFSDGAVARRDVVFGGEFAETVPTELTPIAVVPTRPDPPPPAACFALRVSTVEKAPAMLLVVRDPDPSETRRALKAPLFMNGATRNAAPVAATMELVSPVADTFRGEDHPTTLLFPRLRNRDPGSGLLAFAVYAHTAPAGFEGPRRWADAVAVAGLEAVAEGRRRAVILMLGSAADASRNSPESVRRYLELLGVPLFVWSVKGAAASAWGDVVDVSSREKLERATEAVNRVLDEQRIGWIYADPMTAYRAALRADCGWRRLNR